MRSFDICAVPLPTVPTTSICFSACTCRILRTRYVINLIFCNLVAYLVPGTSTNYVSVNPQPAENFSKGGLLFLKIYKTIHTLPVFCSFVFMYPVILLRTWYPVRTPYLSVNPQPTEYFSKGDLLFLNIYKITHTPCALQLRLFSPLGKDYIVNSSLECRKDYDTSLTQPFGNVFVFFSFRVLIVP